ncbi:MAG TPA: hypothetical protein VGD37_38190 [Kofleriaceae bacterium]|jgi:hypothetical protein
MRSVRFVSLVLLAAACSSHAPSSGSPDAAGAPPDGAIALTCGTTIADYCTAHGCDRTLADAEQDKRLCPASMTVCGDYTVVTQGGVDTSTRYYYRADQLVAIDHTLLPGRRTCSAGPATFFAPACDPGGTALPACP